MCEWRERGESWALETLFEIVERLPGGLVGLGELRLVMTLFGACIFVYGILCWSAGRFEMVGGFDSLGMSFALRETLMSLSYCVGVKMNETELKAMLESFDGDGDGKLTKPELGEVRARYVNPPPSLFLS